MSGAAVRIFSSRNFLSRTCLNGVSAIEVPAYLFRAGFGSKLSRWLTPPIMNSQITLFAFGAKCGKPVGGDHGAPSLAKPSRCSIAPSASPVNPMPTSAKKVRRGTRPHALDGNRYVAIAGWPLMNRDELVMIVQHEREILACPLNWIGRSRDRSFRSPGNRLQFGRGM